MHASSVSFLEMLGLIWLLQLVIPSRSASRDDPRWRLLFSAVELCIPAEKHKEVAELIEGDPLNKFLEVSSEVFGQIASNTLMLGPGFVLHVFV